jgi:hypothetical protein
MGAHHLATVALVVMSYMLNVHLLGEQTRNSSEHRRNSSRRCLKQQLCTVDEMTQQWRL